MVVWRLDFHASPRSFAQAVQFIGCQLFILKFHIIYILPCTYQKTSRTSPLISESHCNLRSCLLTSYFFSPLWHRVIKTLHSCSHSRSHTLALALMFSLSPLCTHPCTCVLTLVILLSHSHSLTFHLSLSHIAYLVKFNYYFISLIIGMVTHLLTPLSSSVATVMTNIFQLNWFSVRSKIGNIADIFGKIEDPENWGVI